MVFLLALRSEKMLLVEESRFFFTDDCTGTDGEFLRCFLPVGDMKTIFVLIAFAGYWF